METQVQSFRASNDIPEALPNPSAGFGSYLLSPAALTSDTLSTFDEYATNPRFLELQEELRELLFNGANSAAPTRPPSPDGSIESPDELFVKARRIPGYRLLLNSLNLKHDDIPLANKLKYLKIWISECAPWLDMFDVQRHFGIQVPVLGQTSPAVLYALLALSARQMERKAGMRGSNDSLKLYQESIRSLTPILDAKDPNVLVSACILCCLEMMSVSPRDWRRHIEGCAALFVSFGVHGFSGGLLQAVFWCYARMDLCGAIIADGAESTVMPIDKWAIPPDFISGDLSEDERQSAISDIFLERGAQIPDMHANYAVYLCAKVCDLICKRTRCLELGEDNGYHGELYNHRWTRLWTELQLWSEKRPPAMIPVKTVTASSNDSLFPAILFSHWAAISSNQLYHTASILMLELKPDEILLEPKLHCNSPLWHARRVVGISMTNPHRGCLNNAIQPLYVAGKLFSHRSEHLAIANLIKHIEATTGWGAVWRIKDLETAWGYERGVFTG